MPLSKETLEAFDEMPIEAIFERLPHPEDTLRHVNLDEIIANAGIQPLGRGDVMLDEDDMQNPVHLLIGRHLAIWICGLYVLDHLNMPLYVELAFCDDTNEKMAAKRFIEQLSFPDTDVQDNLDILLRNSLQPVYIPAQIAHPHGYFIKELLSSPQKMKSLIVAFFGEKNPLICPGCSKIWMNTITNHREHVLWPYHQCWSISGFMGGRCANCIWHGNELCPGRILHAFRIKASSPATNDSASATDGATGEAQSRSVLSVKLNRTTCPRVVCDYPFRLGSDRKSVGDDIAENEPSSTKKKGL